MKFHEMTSGQLRAVRRDGTVVLFPIAACEQHGPHLPTGTDTIICGAIAEQVESRCRDRLLLLPIQWLGASAHHLPFGATLTAELETYVRMLCQTVEPLLRDGYSRLMLLNGHGGNIDPMHVALRTLQPAYPNALLTAGSYWSIAEDAIPGLLEGGDKSVGHACELETSLIMHLRPPLVDRQQIRSQQDWLRERVAGLYMCRDMQQRTREGATGRPDLASPEKGAALFEAIVERVTQTVNNLLNEPLPQ